MHSRIIQLSHQPITEDEYITEELFYDWFVGTIADHVSPTVDREEDIDWFTRYLSYFGAERKGDAIYFPDNFKENYFKKRLEKLKDRVSKITPEDFYDLAVTFGLVHLINDKYGFYVYLDYLMPLDDFVRKLKGSETFYFGNIIDYRF